MIPAWLLGCAAPPCPCDAIALPAGPVTDADALAALVAEVGRAAYPALAGVDVGIAPVDGLAYLRAWTELDTVLLDDGLARTYTVQYDPALLADPPAPDALAALLVHELGHVSDYVAMDSEALAAFAVWYGTQDPLTSESLAAYERATDAQALDRGCADGLAAARDWIYAHASPDVLAEKQHNYYTPDEIAAYPAVCGP
ncbi:MAG: hypothetical protein ABMB14_32135 [Myxococcota bacterium]